MFRFSIREIILVTGFVAVLAAWWLDRYQQSKEKAELVNGLEDKVRNARNVALTLKNELLSHGHTIDIERNTCDWLFAVHH